MAYNMDCDPHGYCIIFNNSFDGPKRRKGTGKDRNEITGLFRKLKYEVKFEEDKNADEMLKCLSQINEDQKNKYFDSLICCFLSHGDENSIHGNDGKSSLPYSAIWSLFGQEKSTLRDKPKVFITQSCQTAVTTRSKDNQNEKMDIDSNLCDSMETCNVEVPKMKFDQGSGTDHADMLFIHASVPGKLFHMSVFYWFWKAVPNSFIVQRT